MISSLNQTDICQEDDADLAIGVCVGHVLVVDDNRDLAESTAELLELVSPIPVTTELAFDGLQAVQAATSDAPPDAIVMDIEMPVMNGLVAAKEIKAALGRRSPWLIAVSSSPSHIEAAETSGMFDGAFLKPVEIDELVSLINVLMSSP